ncbi:hypothetical protein [Streptomyces yangpuensis]
MYGFMLAGAADPGLVADALSEAFDLPLHLVDVAPESEMEHRNWDATVTCDYEVTSGDIHCLLSVYGAEEVTSPPGEEELARILARKSDAPVLISWGTLPWIRKVVRPEGRATFARVEERDDEGAGYRVYATEDAVAAFPGAAVEKFPEVVRDVPVATPVADGLFSGSDSHDVAAEVRRLLWAWEAMISRMAADWPPSHWYGAEMYREDLQSRDQLELALTTLNPEARATVAAVLPALDARFRSLTVDDGGSELATALRPTAQDLPVEPWYWRRRPARAPWA